MGCAVSPQHDERRVLMLRAAEHSLDLRCCIWRNGLTGLLLFDALREAADRGVRARRLLDDQNASGIDEVLAALNSHANIEARGRCSWRAAFRA